MRVGLAKARLMGEGRHEFLAAGGGETGGGGRFLGPAGSQLAQIREPGNQNRHHQKHNSAEAPTFHRRCDWLLRRRRVLTGRRPNPAVHDDWSETPPPPPLPPCPPTSPSHSISHHPCHFVILPHNSLFPVLATGQSHGVPLLPHLYQESISIRLRFAKFQNSECGGAGRAEYADAFSSPPPPQAAGTALTPPLFSFPCVSLVCSALLSSK